MPWYIAKCKKKFENATNQIFLKLRRSAMIG